MLDVREKLSRSEIIEILRERDGYVCFLCKKPFNNDDEITIDHWQPQSKGGTWDIENLRLMTKRCNALKGDRIPNEDGTLPPLKRESIANRRAIRRGERAKVCDTCNSGRKLGPEEECSVCGSGPMPPTYPQWAKMLPQDCDHSGIWWCWACMSGLIDREPASKYVFGGDDLDG